MRAVKAKHLRKVAKAAYGDEPATYDEKPHVVSVMRHTRVLKADCQRALYQTLKSLT